MKHIVRPAFVLFGVLTLVTGVVYPLAVTGAAQALSRLRPPAASSCAMANRWAPR